MNDLVNLYNHGQLSSTIDMAQELTEKYPNAFIVWNILGAAQQGLGMVDEASKSFTNVTVINPNYANGFNNLGVVLKEQGKLGEAVKAYNKALYIKSDFADAFCCTTVFFY